MRRVIAILAAGAFVPALARFLAAVVADSNARGPDAGVLGSVIGPDQALLWLSNAMNISMLLSLVVIWLALALAVWVQQWLWMWGIGLLLALWPVWVALRAFRSRCEYDFDPAAARGRVYLWGDECAVKTG